jgi:hypothetical protein
MLEVAMMVPVVIVIVVDLGRHRPLRCNADVIGTRGGHGAGRGQSGEATQGDGGEK